MTTARARRPRSLTVNPSLEYLYTGNPWGPDGRPKPDVPEEARQQMYSGLLADGLSDAEARATIWPDAVR